MSSTTQTAPHASAQRTARSRQRLQERGGRLLYVRLEPDAAAALAELETTATTKEAICAALLGAARDKPGTHAGLSSST